MTTAIDSVSWQLPVMPSAAGTARRYVRQALSEWRLDGYADDVQLVVSELVTNATRAVAVPRQRDASGEAGGLLDVVWLGLFRSPGLLVVEVWDGAPCPPSPRMAEVDDESGRGLQIVIALCARWGVRRPASGGKVVWCEMTVASPG